MNYCYWSQLILSTVLWDGPRRQRIRLRIVMAMVALDGELAPPACGSLSSVRVCISGQLQSWWELFHPGTTACLFGPQRAGPQLAFLDPIAAPVPHCVCINSLQTAGWGGGAQKAVLCWVLGHPAASPTQKWSNPHQRMQHPHRLAVRVRVWILRSWVSLWGPVVLPLPGSMTLDKLPSKPQFPYL